MSKITQTEYLEILLNDCGFGNRVKRNDFIGLRVGRKIRFLDDLTSRERSILIDTLKARKKDEKRGRDPFTEKYDADDVETGMGWEGNEDE